MLTISSAPGDDSDDDCRVIKMVDKVGMKVAHIHEDGTETVMDLVPEQPPTCAQARPTSVPALVPLLPTVLLSSTVTAATTVPLAATVPLTNTVSLTTTVSLATTVHLPTTVPSLATVIQNEKWRVAVQQSRMLFETDEVAAMYSKYLFNPDGSIKLPQLVPEIQSVKQLYDDFKEKSPGGGTMTYGRAGYAKFDKHRKTMKSYQNAQEKLGWITVDESEEKKEEKKKKLTSSVRNVAAPKAKLTPGPIGARSLGPIGAPGSLPQGPLPPPTTATMVPPTKPVYEENTFRNRYNVLNESYKKLDDKAQDLEQMAQFYKNKFEESERLRVAHVHVMVNPYAHLWKWREAVEKCHIQGVKMGYLGLLPNCFFSPYRLPQILPQLVDPIPTASDLFFKMEPPGSVYDRKMQVKYNNFIHSMKNQQRKQVRDGCVVVKLQ